VNALVRFEDCYVNGWFQGIVIDPFPGVSCYALSVRRCVVVDNFRFITGTPFNPPGFVVNCTGVYAEQADNLLVEECVFDRNGWDGMNYSTRHGQNHNIYIQDNCTTVTVKGNISARGSGDNFQLRPIGTIHKNLSLKSPVHFSMGGSLNSGAPPRTGDIFGNVALEGDDIDPARSLLLGWAYEIKNVEPPTGTTASMRYNIAANKGPNGGSPLGIELNAGKDAGSQFGIRDFQVHDNVVFEWGLPTGSQATASGLEVTTANPPVGPGFGNNVVLYNNQIQEDWNPSQSTATYAFRCPGDYAVTGWTSYGNRFFTRMANRTFMRWYNAQLGYATDFTVASWLSQPGVVDGPTNSVDYAVMDPSNPPGPGYLAPYLAPRQTITTYHEFVASLPPGTGSLDGFMTLCRLQSRGNWNSQLTGLIAVRYFQNGFNMPNPLP